MSRPPHRATETLSGVFVPRAAVVLFDTRPWFYIEHAAAPSSACRSSLTATSRAAMPSLKRSAARDQIVVEGAGILLAKEQGADRA